MSKFVFPFILLLGLLCAILAAGCAGTSKDDSGEAPGDDSEDDDDTETPEGDSDETEDLVHAIIQEPPLIRRNPLKDLPAPGIDTVAAIDSLPLLRLNSRTMQLSSHDLSGGNNDGFIPGTHFTIDENGDYVIFDEYGPGCVYRMWFTGFRSVFGDIKIYVDDLPVVDMSFFDFFLGSEEPFQFPLVYFFHQSSGGFVNYLPIPYKKRCRIVLTRKPEFFHVTWRRYDEDRDIQSFTGREDPARLVEQWSPDALGQDPKPPRSVSPVRTSHLLSPGESATLLETQGNGALWSFFLKPAPFVQELVENLWLTAFWDDQELPAVEAPVNEFFGAFQIAKTPKALLLGHDGERYYCYLPMPFRSSARVVIENRGDQEITVDAEFLLLDEAYGDTAGYFHAARFRQEETVTGQDYLVLDAEGAGHFVGLTLTMESFTGPGYMEGDERIHTDGGRSPALYGTGTEDYFGGGWYYTFGPFRRAIHGATTYISRPGYDLSSSYRMNLGDMIPFARGIHFGIEHDSHNETPGDHYRSVAYYYAHPRAGAVLSDTLEIGDADSEAEHDYDSRDAEPTGELLSFFEGDEDEVEVRDSGEAILDSTSFRLAIDPDNQGVLLRRLRDQEKGPQTARVFVDDAYAGTWHDLPHNTIKRFAQSDFLLPRSLTMGKSEIRIRLDNVAENPWTQFRVEAFSLLFDS